MVQEAFLPAIRFKPVHRYKSDAQRYLAREDGSILCPFSSLPTIRAAAAEAVVAAKEERPFISGEDLRARARLNKIAIALREVGAPDGLLESNQISLNF